MAEQQQQPTEYSFKDENEKRLFEVIAKVVEANWIYERAYPREEQEKMKEKFIAGIYGLLHYANGALIPHFIYNLQRSVPYIILVLNEGGGIDRMEINHKMLVDFCTLGSVEIRNEMILHLVLAMTKLYWYSSLAPLDSFRMPQYAKALELICDDIYPRIRKEYPQYRFHDTDLSVASASRNKDEDDDPHPIPIETLNELLQGLDQQGNIWPLARKFTFGASSLARIDGLMDTRFCKDGKLPSLETMADKHIGWGDIEVFGWAGMHATQSGKTFEDLGSDIARIVLYQTHPHLEFKTSGITLHPDLPQMYAQSLDGCFVNTEGEDAGLIQIPCEIKMRWTGSSTYECAPPYYLGQILQMAIVCPNAKNRCLFVAGQRRLIAGGSRGSKSDGSGAFVNMPDRDSIYYTLTFIDFSQRLVTTYRKLTVAFGNFTQQRARMYLLLIMKEHARKTGDRAIVDKLKERFTQAKTIAAILKDYIMVLRERLREMISSSEDIHYTYLENQFELAETVWNDDDEAGATSTDQLPSLLSVIETAGSTSPTTKMKKKRKLNCGRSQDVVSRTSSMDSDDEFLAMLNAEEEERERVAASSDRPVKRPVGVLKNTKLNLRTIFESIGNLDKYNEWVNKDPPFVEVNQTVNLRHEYYQTIGRNAFENNYFTPENIQSLPTLP